MRERVDFQLELNERFRRLSDRALRASSPVARLVEIDYDSRASGTCFCGRCEPLRRVRRRVAASRTRRGGGRGAGRRARGRAATGCSARDVMEPRRFCRFARRRRWRRLRVAFGGSEDAPADARVVRSAFKCSIDRGESNACELFAKARAEASSRFSLVGRYSADGVGWNALYWYQCWVESRCAQRAGA